MGIDRGATDQHIWPRSHAGNDSMPDKMNLYYSKLLYCEFQNFKSMRCMYQCLDGLASQHGAGKWHVNEPVIA